MFMEYLYNFFKIFLMDHPLHYQADRSSRREALLYKCVHKSDDKLYFECHFKNAKYKNRWRPIKDGTVVLHFIPTNPNSIPEYAGRNDDGIFIKVAFEIHASFSQEKLNKIMNPLFEKKKLKFFSKAIYSFSQSFGENIAIWNKSDSLYNPGFYIEHFDPESEQTIKTLESNLKNIERDLNQFILPKLYKAIFFSD